MTPRVEDHGDHGSAPMLGLKIDLEFIVKHAMYCIAMSASTFILHEGIGRVKAMNSSYFRGMLVVCFSRLSVKD